MDTLNPWIDAVAVAVFAASGALTASRKQMDIVGFAFVGTVTGIGGGTIRDLLLGRPVFWIAEPAPLLVCIVVAGVLFFTASSFESRYRVLLWADAVGLALYSVVGAAKALAVGAPAAVAVLMGVITATFGGVIRDVVCAEVPLILRKEIYATAALAGAGVFVGLEAFGLSGPHAGAAGIAAAFLIRAAAIVFGLSAPVYKPRPGRDYGDGR